MMIPTQEEKPTAVQKVTPKDFIERSFKILDKRGREVPFTLNKAQRYYESKRKKRNIVLKARQQGLTKYLLARRLPYVLTRPTNALMLSNEKDATTRMMKQCQYFIQTMPIRLPFENVSENMIRLGLPSTYFIGTAGQAIVGRGDTLHFAHLSEAAFYKSLSNVMNAVTEACEFGEIDIESTPNGFNDFKAEYDKAKHGESSYNAIFIPWYMSEEYSFEYLSDEELQGMNAFMQKIAAQTDEEILESLTVQEKQLIETAKKEYDIDFTMGMIKWRRYKIADKGKMFFQEYPEDDHSCFLRTEGGVFISITDDETVKVPMDNLRTWPELREMNIDDIEDIMIEYRQKMLYGGIDPAKGTPDGDYHVFSVLDPTRRKDKGAFVYEYRSREPVKVFARHVANICKNYNITLGVESNGVGVAMCEALRNEDVIFQEWNTNGTNRHAMLNTLSESYLNEDVIEGYTEAKAEALAMTYKDDKAVHPKNGHDDRVFSRAIALQMTKHPQYRITHL